MLSTDKDQFFFKKRYAVQRVQQCDVLALPDIYSYIHIPINLSCALGLRISLTSPWLVIVWFDS